MPISQTVSEVGFDSVESAEAPSIRPTSLFESLPRELRDHIYTLAFCEGSDVIQIIDGHAWHQRDHHRRENKRYHTTAPNPPVSNFASARSVQPFYSMLVNKKFFEEATSAWAFHKTIDLTNMQHHENLPSIIRKVKIHWRPSNFDPPDPYEFLRGHPTIEQIEVLVDCDAPYISKERKQAYSHLLEDEDIASMNFVRLVIRLKKLSSIELVPNQGTYGHLDSIEEEQLFEKNLRNMQRYMLSRLAREETEGTETDDEMSGQASPSEEYEQQGQY